MKRAIISTTLRLAALGVCMSAVAVAAHADPKRAVPELCTLGPVHLQASENALLNFYLPAVQNAATPFRVVILDGQGKAVHEAPLTPPPGGGRVFTSFMHVEYDGVALSATDPATGTALWDVPDSDGILIGLLVPAVQKKANAQIGPVAASGEIFDDGGARVGGLEASSQCTLGVNGPLARYLRDEARKAKDEDEDD